MTMKFVDTSSHWELCREESLGLEDMLPSLLANAGVGEVNLVTVARGSSLRGREISEEARGLTAAARAEHRERGFGFWDFVLSSVTKASDDTRIALIRRALQHSAAEQQDALSVDEFVSLLVDGAFQSLPARTVVSITSRITGRTDTVPLHLPMLDFAIHADYSSDQTAVDVAGGALGLSGGDLYRSGTSYHLICDRPVDQLTLHQVLGRAQLLSPIIDHRWAAHQIIDGFCALRISTDLERHTSRHRLIASTRDCGTVDKQIVP